MNREQIERTLCLHKLAYGLLMWLKQRARTNENLLDAEAMETVSKAKSCEEWVIKHLPMIPVQLRPEGRDIVAFSRLFSSFFTTSFRLGQRRWWETVETTLVAGAKSYHDRRHKKHCERRSEEAATELKRLAVAALANESHVGCDTLIMERALIAKEICQELALWTYIRELVRRTEFASQGASVHRLWLELDEKTRKNLSMQLVWQARDNLIGWLKNEVANMNKVKGTR